MGWNIAGIVDFAIVGPVLPAGFDVSRVFECLARRSITDRECWQRLLCECRWKSMAGDGMW
jgi:hypothetical protein